MAFRNRRFAATEVVELPNNTMNPTANGTSLLPHGNRGHRARVEEIGPPAAGYGER
jgi:hypothetical protein